MAYIDSQGEEGYTRGNLGVEINEIIEATLANNGPIIVSWLVQSVLSAHKESNLSAFSKCARFEFVNDEVGRCVRRFKDPEPEELEQLTLPGFKKLQKAYRIERGGDSMIVPIEVMSDEELEMKAVEHGSMARGHITHQREIRRYIRVRRQLRSAA